MDHVTIEHAVVPDLETTKIPKGIASSTMTAGSRPRAIVPTDIEQVWRLAIIIVKSEMAPKDFKTAEKITIAMMHGLEIGLPPMMALQRIAIINNRPCIWGDAVPALALATGQVEDWEERVDGEGDLMVATCRVKRKGIKTPAQRSFSVADAKRADLWDERPKVSRRSRDGNGTYLADNDSPWYRYPKRMLTMRARVAFRDLFADAMGGLYIAEEIIEREPQAPIDVTPKEPVRPDAPPPLQIKGKRKKDEPKETVTPITMTKEAAEVLLKMEPEPAPKDNAPKDNAPKGKPLPPTISRKVSAPVVPPEFEEVQDDALDIPEALKRKPGVPPFSDQIQFKIWLNNALSAPADLQDIHTTWNDTVAPRIDALGAQDQEELLAILDHHERRVGFRRDEP